MVEPDAHLGIYRLISRLGAGGMGEVWKAEDTRLGRTVAIKILPPAVAAEPEAIGRLRREARTAAQLNHPNIATIHAFDESDATLYLVMEYVEGEPLTSLIRRGPMAEADVCRIGRTIADALAEAHAKGVVHRDIKPDNVIVNGPRLKVLDFGIAKRVGPEATPQALPEDPTAFRTQTGFIIGTPNYMSPEQALGKPVDHRTDLFSLGVVLYQCATGRLPFTGETVTETIMKIVRDEPAPARLSPGLRAIVGRCLEKNPAARFQSARELEDALEAQLAVAPTAPYTRKTSGPLPPAPQTLQTTAQPAAPRRWPGIAAVSAIAILGALAGILALRPKPQPPPPAATPKPVAVTTSSAIEAAASTIVEVPVRPTLTTAANNTSATEPPKPSAPPPRTADDYYNEGMARLVERQPFRAREAFESAIEASPNHAKAHFRLGEMALFGRDFAEARRELDVALANGEGLEARERKLAELGLAVLDRNRARAEELLREITAMSPRDPDLLRFRDLVEGPHDRPFRGRKVRPN